MFLRRLAGSAKVLHFDVQPSVAIPAIDRQRDGEVNHPGRLQLSDAIGSTKEDGRHDLPRAGKQETEVLLILPDALPPAHLHTAEAQDRRLISGAKRLQLINGPTLS